MVGHLLALCAHPHIAALDSFGVGGGGIWRIGAKRREKAGADAVDDVIGRLEVDVVKRDLERECVLADALAEGHLRHGAPCRDRDLEGVIIGSTLMSIVERLSDRGFERDAERRVGGRGTRDDGGFVEAGGEIIEICVEGRTRPRQLKARGGGGERRLVRVIGIFSGRRFRDGREGLGNRRGPPGGV